MLIEFRVANFRSFHEEQTLSLVASSGRDETLPGNLIPCEKFDLVKTAAIYGANASGKSNLIKAFDTMRAFIAFSATKLNQGDIIPGISTHRLDRKAVKMPTQFEILVTLDNTRYEYGFTVTQERVYDEWLYVCPPSPKRRRLWYERRFIRKTNKTNWKFNYPFNKNDAGILQNKTRDNGLALSCGANFNIKYLNKLFLWFFSNLVIIDLSERPIELMQINAKYINNNPFFQDVIFQFVQQADLGIEKIEAVEDNITETTNYENRNGKFIFKDKSEHAKFNINTFHKLKSGDLIKFDMETEESNGTQRLFTLAGPVYVSLLTGATLIVDELECSMHPLISRKLIELFHSRQANKNGAQLIFATHDSTLMDPELFRRDQIWITEKNSKGATELYSLYDFDTKDRPRNTERFQRNYLAGRYGGVPNFGPIFEDLEIK